MIKDKKYIAYYISSHGFGHLMRSVVKIKKMLRDKENNFIIICGKKQNKFAKGDLNSFGDRIIYRDLNTDVGLLNCKKSLKVDKTRLEDKLKLFIKNWPRIVKNELDFLRNYNIREVITDISPIGMMVGKKLGVKVIGISNFTWYQQYKFLGLKKLILKKFNEVERNLDELWRYPLYLEFNHLNCKKKDIDFVSRDFNFEKIKKLKKKHKKIIYISCGRSAELNEIKIKNFDGTVFYTDGIKVKGEGEHIKLPLETPDTHNYISASEFIISKAGWGTVSEAILGKTPMVLIERSGVLEDSYTINELKNSKKAIQIKNIETLDYLEVKNKIEEINI